MADVTKYVVIEKRYSPDGHTITKCKEVIWNGILYGTYSFANESAWKRALRYASELSENAGVQYTVEERTDHFAVMLDTSDTVLSPVAEFWIYPVKPMLLGVGYEYRRCHIVKAKKGYTIHHIRRDLASVDSLDDAIRFCNKRLYKMHGD